ncbi:hypothetical protein ACRRTK_021836 [Alexandromys fortis]
MHYSANMVPQKYSLTVNTINPTTGNKAFKVNSVHSLSDNKVPEDSLTTNPINFSTGNNAFKVNSVDILTISLPLGHL